MAFLAAAPEAAAAAEGAEDAAAARGAKRSGRRGGASAGKGRRITPDMSAAEVQEELQDRRKRAQARQDIANNPRVTPEDTGQPAAAPAAAPSSSPVLGRMDPIHTGSGVVLGVVGWVLFMNYMQGGMAQVRRWGAAKFLNKTSGGTK